MGVVEQGILGGMLGFWKLSSNCLWFENFVVDVLWLDYNIFGVRMTVKGLSSYVCGFLRNVCGWLRKAL